MEDFLIEKLNNRIEKNSLRKLETFDSSKIDFGSNDYLGVSKSNILKSNINLNNGSTGSRLISGNHYLFEKVESQIADFHNSESSLIFNSGYSANIGLFSCIASRFDTIIYDELAHTSIRDGIKLSNSRNYSFKHNNTDDLECKVKNAEGRIFVIIESIYSMDGDEPDLIEISKICEDYSAYLIVDEAHAIGVRGRGKGIVSELKLESKTFARIITFGKALGCHGAAILGSETLKKFLTNFARSFIYTTSLSQHSIDIIYKAYLFLESSEYSSSLDRLKENISCFSSTFNKPKSHIQTILIPNNKRIHSISEKLQNEGFFIKPILHPTVPLGKERLRICIHSFNNFQEIKSLHSKIENFIN